MDADQLLYASQLAGGLSAAVAVLLAIVAIPRSLMQASERRKSEHTALFFEALRRTFESCVQLMRILDEDFQRLRTTVRGGDVGTGALAFMSVEIALDRFRSDLTQTLDLYRRAKDRVATEDLLGLFRLVSHLSVLASVHSEYRADEVEVEVGHLIYKGDLSGHIYKCSVIAHWIENDVEKSDVSVEVRKRHPNLLSDMDEAYNRFWKEKESVEQTAAARLRGGKA